MAKEEKIIVLNRMYNGSYIKEGKLGHEIINMYRSDNNSSYIYLQPHGTFNKSHKGKFECVLLVRGVGGGRLEVLGKTVGPVCDVYGSVANEMDYIEKEEIRYNGVSLDKIFGEHDKQGVNITFKVDAVVRPKEPLFLQYGKKSGEELPPNTYVLNVGQAKTSLKQYIHSAINSDDYRTLADVIADDSLWGEQTEMVNDENTATYAQTIFDICAIQDRELSYSSALAYFLNKYRTLASDFVKEFLGVKEGVLPTYKVERERENVDILIWDAEKMIIIENKIDSLTHSDQLKKYLKWAYKDIAKRQEPKKENDDDIDIPRGVEIYAALLKPNYNKIDIDKENAQLKENECGTTKYQLINYSDLHKFMRKQRALYGKDAEFTIFTNAMERHCVEHNNHLYEEMKVRFVERIKEGSK